MGDIKYYKNQDGFLFELAENRYRKRLWNQTQNQMPSANRTKSKNG